MAKKTKDFIMLPTVDYCFKELMRNDIVRQGFVAALLNVDPKTVAETTLLPTTLSLENEVETARTAAPHLPNRVPHLRIASRLAAR